VTDMRARLTLLQVSDSSFPSGAFAFSHGLEGLLRDGKVTGRASIEAILTDQVIPRWLDFDRVFVSRAHTAGAEPDQLTAIDADCDVRSTAPALRNASLSIGRSLLTSHSRMKTPGASAWHAEVVRRTGCGHAAVVQGAMGRACGLDLHSVVVGALYGQVAGVTSAAIRLGKVGALEAQAMLGRVLAAAADGLGTPCPAVPAGFAPLIDIAAQRAPRGHARLFAN